MFSSWREWKILHGNAINHDPLRFRMPGYKNNEWSNIMLVYMKYYILEQCQAKKWDSELTFVSNQYWDHQPIDSDDTSHNNGNDRLHDEVGSHDTHSCNTGATLCSAIGSTQGYGNQTKREERRRRRTTSCTLSQNKTNLTTNLNPPPPQDIRTHLTANYHHATEITKGVTHSKSIKHMSTQTGLTYSWKRLPLMLP